MTSKDLDFKALLEDMHLSMARILEYVEGMDFSKFKQN